MKNLILLLSIALSLQSCAFVAGAAAGAAGIAIVYDHRKLEKIVKDQEITKQISDQFAENPELSQGNHVEVSCFNQIVLLTGEVKTPEQRQQVENIAKNTADVTKVYNEVTVRRATSSITRTSDSWITTKIKTQMLAAKDLQSSTIKVITENGTVYLMGIVNHEQADMAVNIARQVSGVQKVVKIFKYTDK